MNKKPKKLLSLVVAVYTMASAISPIQVNAAEQLKGCKGKPVEMHVSTSAAGVSFQCSDNCGFRSEQIGNSSVSIGGFSMTSIIYGLTFDVSGIHNVTATDATGNVVATASFDIAENHVFGNGTEWEKATCEKDGKKEYTCSYCKEEKTEVIPATGHSFGDWILSTKPTALAKGKERRECQTCHKREYRNVDKLEASVSLSDEEITLKAGKSYTLKVSDVTTGDYVLKWKSSNTKIATAKSRGSRAFTIKAKKAGKATITVTMKSGCAATCVVNVK